MHLGLGAVESTEDQRMGRGWSSLLTEGKGLELKFVDWLAVRSAIDGARGTLPDAFHDCRVSHRRQAILYLMRYAQTIVYACLSIRIHFRTEEILNQLGGKSYETGDLPAWWSIPR